MARPYSVYKTWLRAGKRTAADRELCSPGLPASPKPGLNRACLGSGTFIDEKHDVMEWLQWKNVGLQSGALLPAAFRLYHPNLRLV